MEKKKSISIRVVDGQQQVLDPVRRKWVALTPEEWVRQHVILTLHDTYHYPYELMLVEGAISVGNVARRCDIIIYDRQAKPYIVVECKQPSVPITQRVCDQACRYNTALHVPILILTNGKQTIVIHVDSVNQRLERLPCVPLYTEG